MESRIVLYRESSAIDNGMICVDQKLGHRVCKHRDHKGDRGDSKGGFTHGSCPKKSVPLGMGRRLQVGSKKTSPWLEWASPTFWCSFQCHIDCHVGQMDAWVEPLYKVLCCNLQNLCYAIGQVCRFFGTRRKCKAALSSVERERWEVGEDETDGNNPRRESRGGGQTMERTGERRARQIRGAKGRAGAGPVWRPAEGRPTLTTNKRH